MRPSIEVLETRDVPATVALSNGVLAALGDGRPDRVDFNSLPGQVQVIADGIDYRFDAARVTSLYADGRAGDDLISNNTLLPSTLLGGAGDDTLFGGNSRDTILPGAGRDLVYDLVGGSTVLASGGGADRVYVGANDAVLSDPEDRVVRFFAAGRTPGAGTVSLENGVVYITPPDGGTVTQVRSNGKSLLVTSSFGNFAFDLVNVHTVAYFGGRGDDVASFDVKLDVVAYGGLGGNDTLAGGFGRALLKGGGGNDTLIARGTENDLSGNGGADVLIGGVGRTTLRIDALDAVFAGPADIVLGLTVPRKPGF